MDFPTPDDPKRAPVWENYVVAQAAQAALRLIPVQAHAIGVEVAGTRVTLVLQASEASMAADEDLNDIVSDLEALLGPHVEVSARLETSEGPRLNPHDGVRWFFASRA